MSEFVGANSSQYRKLPIEIIESQRVVLDTLAQFGGPSTDYIESMVLCKDLEVRGSAEAAEGRGYFHAVRTMVDAGFRYGIETDGLASEPACTERELIDALAKHDGFPYEWLESLEGRPELVVAESKGYLKAIEIAVKAGFKLNWVDNRKQHF